MDQAPRDNPFAALNGALPNYYLTRAGLGALDEFRETLVAGQAPASISLIGPRGSGKSVELARAHDALLEDGVLVLSALLSDQANDDLDSFLQAGFDDLLHDRPSRAKLVKTTIRGGIPWFSLEQEFSALAPNAQDLCDRVTDLLDPACGSRAPGVVLLLDEGDFLSRTGFQNGLAPLLNRAANSRDFPFGLIAAGSGWDFDRAMRGKGSYVRDIIKTVPVQRLSPAESLDLLIETAKLGGQTWTATDARPVVDVCEGVPRLLNDAGGRLFSRWSPDDSAAVVKSVASETKAARDHALSLMPTSAYRALDLLRRTMGEQVWSSRDLRQEIARLSGTEHFGKLDKAVNTLFSHGYLEYRVDLTIALAQC